MSGAAVFDLETGHAIAVQSSYVPDDPADPDPGDSRATEIAWLVERASDVRHLAVPLQVTSKSRSDEHNLPSDLNRFIGREREVSQVRKHLKKHRLVTLTGPGGVGKTRLAIEVCRRLAATTPGGVRLAELGPLAATRLNRGPPAGPKAPEVGTVAGHSASGEGVRG